MSTTGHSTRERTREQLVDAGVRLLRERPDEGLRRLLAAQDVARVAGVHRQTFYRHWPDPDAYVAEVVTRAIRPKYVAQEILEPLLIDLSKLGIDGARNLIHEIADLDLRSAIDDPSYPPLSLLWALNANRARARYHGEAGDEPHSELHERIATGLQEVYASIAAGLEPLYQAILTGWKRHFIAGFDVHDFATTATAMVEGLIKRTLADPGAVRPGLYGDVVTRVLLGLTEADAISPTSAATPAPVSPPGASPQDGPATAGSPGDDGARPAGGPANRRDARHARADRSRAKIVEAARFEFEMRGFTATTIASIAASAGLSEATVFAHFGSKDTIAAHVFAAELPGLRAALSADLAGGSPLTAVRNHLARLGAVVRARPGLADGVLHAVSDATMAGPPSGRNDPRLIAPLPDVLLPAILAGQETGEIRSDLPARQVATSMTNLTMVHSLTRRTTAADDAAGFLTTLFVDGLAPRPASVPLASEPRG